MYFGTSKSEFTKYTTIESLGLFLFLLSRSWVGSQLFTAVEIKQITTSVQIVSSQKLTRPLVMRDKTPAGKGTITVRWISS